MNNLARKGTVTINGQTAAEYMCRACSHVYWPADPHYANHCPKCHSSEGRMLNR